MWELLNIGIIKYRNYQIGKLLKRIIKYVLLNMEITRYKNYKKQKIC